MTRTSGGGSSSWVRLGIGVVLLAAAVVCSFASTAGAQVVVDKITGVKLGILPPPSHAVAPNRSKTQKIGFASPTCDNVTVDTNCAHPLTYYGGPVQHAENDYLFFWDPNGFSSAPGYEAGMAQWLSDLAGGDFSPGHIATSVGNPVSVTQEYYDLSGPGKTKRFVSYDVTNAGTIMDTDPYPANGCTDAYADWFNNHTKVTLATCLTQSQLFIELSHYIAAHHLPTGLSTEYFILTPPNVGGCADATPSDCAIQSFCAYHSLGGTGANPILYAYQPWLQGTTCDVNRVNSFTNIYASTGIDAVVGTVSHELSETMTDPELNGWSYATPIGSLDEIGDKCAYQYDVGQKPFETFTGLPTVSGTPYNTVLGTDNYLLQEEFDNRNHGCNQWDTDAQPTATVNAPGTATTGAAATYSVGNVVTTGNIGLAYVTWLFGDGSSATSVGSTAINHYFQAPGSYAASAIVTDNHGNEVKVPAGSGVAVSAPTTPQLQGAVDAIVKPIGAGAKIEKILAAGGYTFIFSTMTAGTFHMVWKHGATTLAAITKTLSILGPNKLKITLTVPGHNLLVHANTLSIASSESFTPAASMPLTDTANFAITR